MLFNNTSATSLLYSEERVFFYFRETTAMQNVINAI